MYLPILQYVHVSACPLHSPPSLHAQGWLCSRPSHESDILWNLFDKTFESVLTYVCVNLDAKMEVLECNFIKQVKCAMQCTYTYTLYTRVYNSISANCSSQAHMCLSLFTRALYVKPDCSNSCHLLELDACHV